LRTDLPNVRDRHDSEASEMQKTTDPQIVLNALKETLNTATTIKDENNVQASIPSLANPQTMNNEGSE
jgi:hypothetical protein